MGRMWGYRLRSIHKLNELTGKTVTFNFYYYRRIIKWSFYWRFLLQNWMVVASISLMLIILNAELCTLCLLYVLITVFWMINWSWNQSKHKVNLMIDQIFSTDNSQKKITAPLCFHSWLCCWRVKTNFLSQGSSPNEKLHLLNVPIFLYSTRLILYNIFVFPNRLTFSRNSIILVRYWWDSMFSNYSSNSFHPKNSQFDVFILNLRCFIS